MSLFFSTSHNVVIFTNDVTGQIIPYRLYNDVYYHNETPQEVVLVLDDARRNNRRIRLHYGYTKSDEGQPLGWDWMGENMEGTIGVSTGPLKVPLLIKNSRSTGGGAILDDCIVKITGTIGSKNKNRYVYYKHPNYHRPVITIRTIKAKECVGKVNLREEGYTHAVCFDGVTNANFKNEKQAKNYARKMS